MKYQALFDSLKKGLHLKLFAVAVFVAFKGYPLVALRMKNDLLHSGFSFVIVNLVRGGGTYVACIANNMVPDQTAPLGAV